jgi:tRNA uridine 5-carbamoylmethylation protein Kti12
VKILKADVPLVDNNKTSAEPETSADETIATTKAAPKATKSSWKPKKKPSTTEPVPSEEPNKVSDEAITNTIPTTVFEDMNTLSISGSTISNTDDMSIFVDYEEVLEKILDHITTASAPVPNSSTVAPQHAQADLLYELDRISAKILQLIMTHQTDNLEGTPLKMPDYDRALTLHRHVSLAELQRYRGQYIKINGKQPPTTPKAIGASFVDFLATHLE